LLVGGAGVVVFLLEEADRRPRSAGMGNEPDVIAATVMFQTIGLVRSYVGFGGSSSEAWWGLFSTVR
jgi:hypothetical protein